jgi:hypothetical protein
MSKFDREYSVEIRANWSMVIKTEQSYDWVKSYVNDILKDFILKDERWGEISGEEIDIIIEEG